MRTTQFPNGATVVTFSPPGGKFEAAKASDDVLARHGLPARPTAPEYIAQLQRQMEYTDVIIEPTFRVMHTARPDLARVNESIQGAPREYPVALAFLTRA
jgi:hypothetical protein